MPTKIEWCDETINPIQAAEKGKSGRGYHCTKVSPGCDNCYAEVLNRRFGNRKPFDDTPTGFELIRSELEKPPKWKSPKRVFVQSMGDLFHPDISNDLRNIVFGMMANSYKHTYMVLTKRPTEMLEYFSNEYRWALIEGSAQKMYFERTGIDPSSWLAVYDLPNLWLGVTVCNQTEADEKIPQLLQAPRKKFLSIEPMLGPIKLAGFDGKTYRPWLDSHAWEVQINAVIVGGESGPKARPMHPDWVRSVRDQCLAAGVPFFFKGWGEWSPGRQAPELSDGYMSNRPCIMLDDDGRTCGAFRVGKKKAGRLLDGREWNAAIILGKPCT